MPCLVLLMWLGLQQSLHAQARPFHEETRLAAAFEKRGLTGCFVVLDPVAHQLRGFNRQRAERRFPPASTFKIANALIGLETGVVKDTDEVLPYGGTRERLKQWEQDMNLKDAMKTSNVAVFHQLAKRTGLERMQTWLARLSYGNAEAGPTIERRFWLEGPLAISPVEQVDFLNRLAKGELPIRAAAGADLRQLLLYEKKGESALYAKTGWVGPKDPQIGWWVGWVEKDKACYPFALNIRIRSDADAKERIPVALECLRSLGVW